MEVLAGSPDFVTTVKEDGFQYEMDFSKVYWNPRLGILSYYKCIDLCVSCVLIHLYSYFNGYGFLRAPSKTNEISLSKQILLQNIPLEHYLANSI